MTNLKVKRKLTLIAIILLYFDPASATLLKKDQQSRVKNINFLRNRLQSFQITLRKFFFHSTEKEKSLQLLLIKNSLININRCTSNNKKIFLEDFSQKFSKDYLLYNSPLVAENILILQSIYYLEDYLAV